MKKMITKQGILALAAVLGYAAGRPLMRRFLGTIPGLPSGEMGENTVGAAAALVAFQVAKRMV